MHLGKYGKIVFFKLKEFYRDKKIFITGHSGFKGAWLNFWLTSMGADVFGYSLPPTSEYSLHETLKLKNGVFADILDYNKLCECINNFRPDIVFHLAAQPLVRFSYKEPVLTYMTNVMGTLNVLEAARNFGGVKAFVNVTTDKCYENNEQNIAFEESMPMGGYDMYSSSKACVEILSQSYRSSFLSSSNSNFALATARAGNVIGGGDWAEDRLIPDCVKAINNDVVIDIRSPNSIRPWQHVLEPLSGYLLLGFLLYEHGFEFAEPFNFGPELSYNMRVVDVVRVLIENYGRGQFEINESTEYHEAKTLLLDINKAKNKLGWMPVWSCYEAVKNTVDWYKAFYQGETDMCEFSLNQIKDYEGAINWKNCCETK